METRPVIRTQSLTGAEKAELWRAADTLRGHMDAAEYKHVVLGLIFLKYISDAFDERHAELEGEADQGADPEDKDEYVAEGLFWVPPDARWSVLKDNAKQPTIGTLVDGAMESLERENPSLRDVLPKQYARPTLNKTQLGQLIDNFSNLKVGGEDSNGRDVLGQVYEYFLAEFASAEGKQGGDRLRDDRRWQFGAPPVGNANFAWVQHFIHHLAPNGVAGFVLANGSLSTSTSGEGVIRKEIVEADLVDCIVSMPGQLFYSTQIPVSLWFLSNNKRNGRGQEGRLLRDRSGEILFIDARQLGEMEDRTHRILTDDHIAKITGTYHAWRGDGGEYEDVPGFCKAASLDEVRAHGHVLTPGRYVCSAAVAEDGEPFAEKMDRLTEQLRAQFVESNKLETLIRENLIHVKANLRRGADV